MSNDRNSSGKWSGDKEAKGGWDLMVFAMWTMHLLQRGASGQL